MVGHNGAIFFEELVLRNHGIVTARPVTPRGEARAGFVRMDNALG